MMGIAASSLTGSLHEERINITVHVSAKPRGWAQVSLQEGQEKV
jgi:hypothetical protein